MVPGRPQDRVRGTLGLRLLHGLLAHDHRHRRRRGHFSVTNRTICLRPRLEPAMKSSRMRWWGVLGAAALVAACEHEQPAGPSVKLTPTISATTIALNSH